MLNTHFPDTANHTRPEHCHIGHAGTMAKILILSNPRSGSTFLTNLLNCHPEVNVADELLNDEMRIDGDPLDFVADHLSRLPENVVGFKVK